MSSTTKTKCRDQDVGLSILSGNIWWCNSCKASLDKMTMLEHIMLDSHARAMAEHAAAVCEGKRYGGRLSPK
jgi:hypothetical protein